MQYYRKKDITIESICIDKITKGIQSIRKGTRSGVVVGKDLEYVFSKLEERNKNMFQELYIKYSTTRLEVERIISV